MIQTGHSGGAPAMDNERKVIANTLWYLAQFTTETTSDMLAAQDKASPDMPTATRVATNCGKLKIKSKDNGTAYKYYVVATDLTNSAFVKNSNDVTSNSTTGLKGFYISEDSSPAGTPNTTGEPTHLATDNQELEYTVGSTAKYIHIVAVDHAGNKSAVCTLEPVPTIAYSAAEFCNIGTANVTRTGLSGGMFSAAPAGLSISSTTGSINLATSSQGTYTVTYTYPTGCTPATAIVKVNTAPTITIANVEANEGSNLLFTVRLSGTHCTSQNATLSYQTQNGTATAQADYTAASGTLTFLPGETEKTFTVVTLSDKLLEGNETMHIRLYSPVNCYLEGKVNELKVTGTIKDRTDGTIVVEKYSPTNGNAGEPSTGGSFFVRFADKTVTCTSDVTLAYTLTGASNPQDYQVVTGTNVTASQVIIPAGSNGVELPIKVNNNFIVQGERTLTIELTNILP